MDRPSVQFAVHEIMPGMCAHTVMHWAKLHRPARYMLQYLEESRDPRVPAHTGNAGSTDGPIGPETETQKSVSCTSERLGGHLLDSSVAKQTLVALSSGESEFNGIVRAAAFGIQTHQLLCQLGVPLRLDILCDSSAAREVCTRSGSGKVRHLSIKELWVQEALRNNEFGSASCGSAPELGGRWDEVA